MLIIKKASKRLCGDSVKLYAKYEYGEESGELWFSTDRKYGNYLCQERGDAFLVAMLLFAMERNIDIRIEDKISQRLIYGIENYLMKSLVKMNNNYNMIKIECEIALDEIENEQGVGTGISCGVDSFYTINQHIDDKMNKYKLTHLTLFNSGAFGERGGDEARFLFNDMKGKAKKAAKDIGLPLVWVDSNISEVINMPFEKTHTFRNLACVLALSKLFKTYYYSSGHSIEYFKLNFSDPSNYDIINSESLSTDNLEIFITGLLSSRFEKTREIATYLPTYKNLNVCLVTPDNINLNYNNKEYINCSKCFKCIRTMLTLDVIGKLELYDKVFDLTTYYDNKSKYIAENIYLMIRAKDEFATEIYKNMKLVNYNIPIMTWVYLVNRFFDGFKNGLYRLIKR